MECSGFYFHVEPGYMFLGGGLYMFPDNLLKKYREIVYNPDKANELHSIINKMKRKTFSTGGKTYKRVPKGFDPEYPFSDYLLYSGLYVYEEFKDLKKLKEEDIVKLSFKRFKEMLPIHKWMVKNI